jgi:hypothetical protein
MNGASFNKRHLRSISNTPLEAHHRQAEPSNNMSTFSFLKLLKMPEFILPSYSFPFDINSINNFRLFAPRNLFLFVLWRRSFEIIINDNKTEKMERTNERMNEHCEIIKICCGKFVAKYFYFLFLLLLDSCRFPILRMYLLNCDKISSLLAFIV